MSVAVSEVLHEDVHSALRYDVRLATLRITLFAIIALAFPLLAWCVHGAGVDRAVASDGLSFVFGFGFPAALSTAYWPLAETSHWTRAERARSTALVFLGASYTIHLTWELGWLLFHRAIIAAPESVWSYPWWAYIDGGDARYAHPTGTLIGMEALSVLNGAIGATALVKYLRGSAERSAVLVMAGTAVVHLYSACLYFVSEIVDGFPNVDTTSFVDVGMKFTLANAPWVVAPWFVFAWARHELGRQEP